MHSNSFVPWCHFLNTLTAPVGLRTQHPICIPLGFLIALSCSANWLAGQTLPEVPAGGAIYDTQAITSPLTDPSQVSLNSKLPPGFVMQVVAKEPDVQQPIGMTWDTRGRLWVAENYTYSEVSKGFDTNLSDRIVILEDTDGDGTLDKRKVFWDQGKKLTSIETGEDGVWALAPPNLLFIPDQNRDDVPDSAPIIVLDGFDQGMRHNVANGLRFGPDGWLYGRHGILGVSNVGLHEQFLKNNKLPLQDLNFGAQRTRTFGKQELRGNAQRTQVHCGIWRYNTRTFEFQVVTQGTTNPWGMDWDAYGNLFFINTVIGHLWHAIPNSHLQRMYGEDLDPFTYELLPHIADHVHWDEKGENWMATRKGAPSSGTDAAGGGHAHSGMMIYQADNWPEEYRNHLYTLNFHGQRINRDKLVHQGSGYVGKHQDDMVFWKDPWFRGIELSTGPDGSVYVLDWSDLGECHEDDGVHRHSGRIYRIAYEPSSVAKKSIADHKAFDLEKLSKSQLLALLKHPNAWHARFAQSILSRPKFRLSSAEVNQLRDELFTASFPGVALDPLVVRLRSLWALNATENLDSKTLIKVLRSNPPDEMSAAAVRLMADYGLERDDAECSELHDELMDLLDHKQFSNKNSLLRLYAAALHPKLSMGGWKLATALAQSEDLANDRDFPLVLWYGIKDQVQADPVGAAKLCLQSRIPKLSEFIVRRLASLHSTHPEGLDALVNDVSIDGKPDRVSMLIDGMWLGYLGMRTATPPKGWDALSVRVAKVADPQVQERFVLLQSLFGSGMSTDKLLSLAMNGNAQSASRRAAIDALATVPTDEVRSSLWQLLSDQYLGGAAAVSIAKQASPEEARRLAAAYSKVWPPAKKGILIGLTSKAEWMHVLIQELENKTIPIQDVDASTWQQFQLVSDFELLEKARKLNPKQFGLAADKEEQIQKLDNLITDQSLANADAGRGRTIWNNACGTCHKLYGEGQAIGPELTGSQRTNKRFWLENILAPSSQVAPNSRLVMFRLIDDTIVNGVPVIENKETVTVQTAKEKVVLSVSDIEERKTSNLSLMPEGLLAPLSDQDKLDLFRYLMSSEQVPAK